MLSHNYNTRLNSLTSIEENTPTEISVSNDTIADTPLQTNANTTSRFDGLDNELLNLKDVIIKNLQVENERLRKKVDFLENKILTLKSKRSSLE